jgi:hypothetical protein
MLYTQHFYDLKCLKLHLSKLYHLPKFLQDKSKCSCKRTPRYLYTSAYSTFWFSILYSITIFLHLFLNCIDSKVKILHTYMCYGIKWHPIIKSPADRDQPVIETTTSESLLNSFVLLYNPERKKTPRLRPVLPRPESGLNSTVLP